MGINEWSERIMSTKKKVGLAGIMGMQSRPVDSTQTSTTAAQDKKKQVVAKSKTATNTPKKAVIKYAYCILNAVVCPLNENK